MFGSINHVDIQGQECRNYSSPLRISSAARQSRLYWPAASSESMTEYGPIEKEIRPLSTPFLVYAEDVEDILQLELIERSKIFF